MVGIGAWGLVLDIVGVAVLFAYGPVQPEHRTGMLLLESTPDEDRAIQQRRRRYVVRSRIGLLFVFVGFVFQLAGAL